MTRLPPWLHALLLTGALCASPALAQEIAEETPDDAQTGAVSAATSIDAGGAEIPVERYPTDGEAVLLWFPSEHGLLDGHRQQALALQAVGVEVWLADPFAGHFLPEAASSFDEMPTETVGDLIEAAHAEDERAVFVFGNDRALPWLLTGLYHWQEAHPEAEHLAGLIMMSPYLHTGVDTDEAEMQPIVGVTNLPIYIIQPMLSPQFQHLGLIRSTLSDGGSPVGARLLPELRDRFFFRPDAMEAELLAREIFHQELVYGMDLLRRLPAARTAAASDDRDLSVSTPTGGDVQLDALDEPIAAPELVRPDLAGKEHRLEDYRGEVVLINFWASWCPPCVHEMPSMQLLEDELREEGFRILAVNLGEDEETIRDFIENEVQTEFTILLDPDQESLNDWRAMAYPTSYVVDREGNLRYYLFGAIEWTEPGVVDQMRELLEENYEAPEGDD
ncbi:MULTISPECIES: redoxin domain-containing protein [unclassified Thioalkalivibrio]|uniref:redoxin domain-containing protein n=1 Tax=unclassified Thioalkalivibrio TaxID=2621013 RepID=UPI0003802FD1|nr:MULTISPECIES: redoxin domain-containing protein [unclassified Thioalkalivibrio]